jgi:hypothetical protein
VPRPAWDSTAGYVGVQQKAEEEDEIFETYAPRIDLPMEKPSVAAHGLSWIEFRERVCVWIAQVPRHRPVFGARGGGRRVPCP